MAADPREIVKALDAALTRYEYATDAVAATAAGDDPHAAALAGIELEKAAALLSTWTQPEYLRVLIDCAATPAPAPVPEPIARVELTPIGPKLFIRGVMVRWWLGCIHDREAEAVAAEINGKPYSAPAVEAPAVGAGEERRQLQHLLDDIVEEASQDGHAYYRIRDGADVLFSNMVGACARLLAQPAAQAIAADAEPVAVVESATGGPKGLPLLLWMVDLPCMDAKVQAGDKLYLHPGNGKLSIRQLTDEELAACCGGCRSNSAIETWMRRAVAKFCEVNGISYVPVQHKEQS